MMKMAHVPDATHLALNAVDRLNKTALLVILCNICIIVNALMNARQVILKIKKTNSAQNA